MRGFGDGVSSFLGFTARPWAVLANGVAVPELSTTFVAMATRSCWASGPPYLPGGVVVTGNRRWRVESHLTRLHTFTIQPTSPIGPQAHPTRAKGPNDDDTMSLHAGVLHDEVDDALGIGMIEVMAL
ncbi:hypothetical protein Pan216_16340 [Planctomycetes bacterium Pan216]|uniref:Uncharacterized protein n=1 Tax=Kolteria novifilia TaxID=2527975 RepID=A0A518B1F6_9BACT|nr:hypothetical protein Pan216_16340 [Planctomycetes bacterium Pan216]